MIIKSGGEVKNIYRGGQAVKEVYKGEYKVWPSVTSYLRVDRDLIWVTPWDIERLLIESNVDWTIL